MDEEEFLGLRPHWDALFYNHGVKFVDQSHLWARMSWNTIARPKGRTLHIIVGEANGKVVLIFPLVVQRIGLLRIARWLGPGYDEYCDMLVSPHAATEQWIAEAWNVAVMHFHLLRLPAVRSDARIWPHVQQARAMQSTLTRAPFVDCRRWQDWQTYHASRSRNFRRDCKRALKRLEQSGTPHFAMIQEDQVETTINWLLARKVEWLDRHSLETENLASKKGFFSSYCREALPRGEVLLTELVLNGTRIAAQMAFRADDRLDASMIAWVEDWQACAPGRLLDLETIHWAFEHGLATVDLGMGTQDYKYRFADQELKVAKDVTIAPHPLGGFLLGLQRGMRQLHRLDFHVRRYARAIGAKLAHDLLGRRDENRSAPSGRHRDQSGPRNTG